MERLELDLIQLKKSLVTLGTAFTVEQQLRQTSNEQFILAAQDSIIQRFEYCYEGFWKFLKRYLEQRYMLDDISSPKKVFRACVKMEIYSTQIGDIFIDMADDRNETSHTYSIESARLILSDIPRYYATIVSIVQHIEANMNK